MKVSYLIMNELFLKGLLYRVEVTGPYDGCFYEPTYGYCYQDGQVDFFSYGDPKEWSSRMKSAVDVAWENFEKNKTGEFVANTEGMTTLFGHNPGHAVGAATMLRDNHDLDIEIKCPDCKTLKPLAAFTYDPDAYHGDGGVGVIHTDWMCPECKWDGTCEVCHHYRGTDDVQDVDGKTTCTECRIPECPFCEGSCDDNEESIELGVCDYCAESDDDAKRYIADKQQHEIDLQHHAYEKVNQVFLEGCEETKPPKPPSPLDYID